MQMNVRTSIEPRDHAAITSCDDYEPLGESSDLSRRILKQQPHGVVEPQSKGIAKAAETADELVDRFFPLDLGQDAFQVWPWFNKLMTFCIMLNCLQIGLECEWSHKDYPQLVPVYIGMDVVFAFVFTSEIFVKWYLSGPKEYFGHVWNVIDFVITLAMLGDLSMVVLPTDKDSIFHQLVKTARLARCLRLIRLLRVLKAQPELIVVVEGLLKSGSSLIWVIISLMAIMYFFGIFFTMEVDHDIFAGPDTPADASTCEKDPFFCTLSYGLRTLLDVVVGAEWSGLTKPFLLRQPMMIVPFICFVLLTTFGILNVVVGVIVDATAETKVHLVWRDKRENLLKVSRMWQDQIVERGLALTELDGLQGAVLIAKKLERQQHIEVIVQHVIDSGIIDFPEGIQAKSVISLLSRKSSGDLNHEDFTCSLGRLLLADNHKLMFQTLINQAKQTELMRQFHVELQADVDTRLEKIETMIAKADVDKRLEKIESMLAKLTESKT